MMETPKVSPRLPAGRTLLALPPAHRRWLLTVLALVFGCIVLTSAFFALQHIGSATQRLEKLLGLPQQELLPLTLEDPALLSLPVTLLVTRAEEAQASGDLLQAQKLYESALAVLGREVAEGKNTDGESDLRILRQLFDIALLRNNKEKAEEVLGLLSFRGVSEKMLSALRGFLSLRLGDTAGAREFFREPQESPDHAYGRMLLFLREGAHEDAQQELDVVEKSADPLLARAGRTIRGAYDEFALFEEGRPEHRATLLARALAEVGQCPIAEHLLTDAVAREPEYRDAWLVLGYCRLMLEDPPGALRAFEEAYALDPEKAETQYFLGLTSERLGKTEEARQYLGYALENGFEPQRVLREKIAQNLEASGNAIEALEQYRAILTLEEEDHAPAYRAMVTLLLERLNDPMEAQKIAEQARAELGDTSLVLDLLGWTAMKRGQHDDAATYLTVAVQQDPGSASAWYHKGLLAEEVSDRTEALRCYRMAYELTIGLDADFAALIAEKHNALMLEKD